MSRVRAAISAVAFVLLVIAISSAQQTESTAAPASKAATSQAPAKQTDCPQPPDTEVLCGSVLEVPVVPPQELPAPETKPLIDPKEPSVLGELEIITINR